MTLQEMHDAIVRMKAEAEVQGFNPNIMRVRAVSFSYRVPHSSLSVDYGDDPECEVSFCP